MAASSAISSAFVSFAQPEMEILDGEFAVFGDDPIEP